MFHKSAETFINFDDQFYQDWFCKKKVLFVTSTNLFISSYTSYGLIKSLKKIEQMVQKEIMIDVVVEIFNELAFVFTRKYFYYSVQTATKCQ